MDLHNSIKAKLDFFKKWQMIFIFHLRKKQNLPRIKLLLIKQS